MAFKIILDPGHGGSDPGATYNGRQEKDDALRLTMIIGEMLKTAGYQVEYTRTTDIYNTPFEKSQMGNKVNANLFVSIHRNSSLDSNKYDGIQSLVYSNQGFKKVLATNINSNLEALGFQDKGIVERPNLVVLKRTKMPAILLEVGFINSDKDNEIFDEKLEMVAEAIADGIIDSINNEMGYQNVDIANALVSKHRIMDEKKKPKPEPNRPKPKYQIQVGAFRNKQLAVNLMVKLQRERYDARIVYENDLFKVRVGEFEDLDNAAKVERILRGFGYSTFITM